MENNDTKPLFREAVSLLRDPGLSYAIKVLFYAQSEPGELEKLQKFIALRQSSLGTEITWSLRDENFVSALKEYATLFTSEAQAEHPDIADMVEASAPREMLEAIEKQLSELPAQQRRRFAEALTRNFIDQLKKQGVNFENFGVSESHLRSDLLERVIEVSFDAKTDREFSEEATRQIENIFRVRTPGLAVSPVVDNVIKEYTPLYEKLLSHDDLPVKIQDAVITAPTARKDLFAKILTELSLENTKATQDTLSPRALELSHAAEALTSDFVPNEQETKLPGFFGKYATSVSQKTLAPIADFLFGRLSSPRQVALVESYFARALGSVLQNTDLLTTKFGSEFVSSRYFQNYIQTSGMALASQPTTAKAGGARGIVDDFIGFLLAGTVVGGFFGIPETPVLNTLELNALGVFTAPFIHKPSSVATPEGSRRSAVGGRALGLFSLFPSVGSYFSWNLLDLYHVLVSQKVGSSRVEGFLDKTMGKAAWIFRFGSLPFSRKRGVTRATPKPISVLGRFLGNLFQAVMGERFGFTVGRFIGNVLSSVVGKIVRLIPFVAFVGFVSKIFTGGLNLLRYGVRQKTRWQDDWPLVAAVAITVIIVLLFIFPNVFNFTKNTDAARLSALATSTGGGGEGGGYEFTPGPAIPFSNTGWPTTGCIVQGPFWPDGSHRSLNAIDIDAPTGTPVYATHAGRVAYVETGWGINEVDLKNGGYGNWVMISGADEKNNTYSTIYGHLAGVAPGIAVGFQVVARQLIGYTDHNGYSYEPHLHYEYRGGGTINTILPFDVPSCGYSDVTKTNNCSAELAKSGHDCRVSVL